MNSKKIALNQSGFISIFTSLIIMTILTLLVIGFSYTTRQAQRRTLDDLLSNQAFYSAESGVNEAVAALRTTPLGAKPNCDDTGSSFPPGAFSYDVDSSLGLTYTCLLIKSEVEDYENDFVPVIGTDEPIIIPIEVTGDLPYMDFEWDSATSSTFQAGDNIMVTPGGAPTGATGGSPRLPTAGNWEGGSGIGMVRIDLVPTASAAYSRVSMTENSYTFFLYPTRNGTYSPNASITVSNGPYDRGETLITRCNSALPYRCRGRVNFTNNAGISNYFMRIQAYYNPVKISLSPDKPMRGLQAVVDATGKANHVFRRIQVRVPLSHIPGSHLPFSLLSDSICKRYIGAPPDGLGAGGTIVVDGGLGLSSEACSFN